MATSQNKKMPALFIGHGSPMNALANNAFTKHLVALGESLPRPKKILMISAHWNTRGVQIQSLPNPNMIYDFYGFPEALSQIQYPALGDVDFSQKLHSNLQKYSSVLDNEWGFDHGTWSILLHMYPKADIPVVQLSLNQNFLNLRNHYEMAQELKKLREEGVLIIGSGNIVHNLRQISRAPDAPPIDWAKNFDEIIKTAIIERNLEQFLAEDPSQFSLWKMAHPSIEHYLPLLYILGASTADEKIIFPYEAFEHGSLAMRSVLIGA